MADQKISELNSLTGTNVDNANDTIAIVDSSASETKKIIRSELFYGLEGVNQKALSSDPADPAAGEFTLWLSDGTGSGDAGDVMLKINVGGTTKTITLVDYSAS